MDLTILLWMRMWECWVFIQARVLGLVGLKPWPNYIGLPLTGRQLMLSDSLMTEKHTPHLFTRNSYYPSYPNQACWTLERRGIALNRNTSREVISAQKPNLHSSKGYFPTSHDTWNVRGHKLQSNAYISKNAGAAKMKRNLKGWRSFLPSRLSRVFPRNSA